MPVNEPITFTPEELAGWGHNRARQEEELGCAIEEPLPGMPEPGPEPKYQHLPKYSSRGNRYLKIESHEDAIAFVTAIIDEIAPFPERVTARHEGDVRPLFADGTCNLNGYQVAKARAITGAIRGRITMLSSWPRIPPLIIVINDYSAVVLWDEEKRVFALADEPLAVLKDPAGDDA